jgi:NAD(P)-dependent dehydrogenase (short-subunit alcohol dehydrogenase family)
MPTLAIVGAGPGLGLEIARVFGAQGFSVALLARTQSRLDELATTLGGEGITAAGFAADLTDEASLVRAFDAVRARFGEVDVLEFSPVPHTAAPDLAPVDVLEVAPANLQPQLDFYLFGGIAVVRQVLPTMLATGTGTLLFTTGGGSVTPIPVLGNVNVAAAALRNWVLNLHGALAPKGVYAAHVAISAWIGSGKPEAEASVIAQEYWNLYEARDRAELHYIAMPDE